MRSKQLNLFTAAGNYEEFKDLGRTVHGGEGWKGKRKTERPVILKKWHDVILKSDKAKGALSFWNAKNRIWIEKLVRSKAKKFKLELGDYVNSGNHLHLKLKPADKESLGKFLKSVTGSIARIITGARRGKSFGRFWEGLAFSRVLQSSKEDLYLRGYFRANRIQLEESYSAREKFLKNLKT